MTEILEQQHSTRVTAAAKHVAEIPEQKHAPTTAANANEGAEILEQHTAVTAACKEVVIHSKDTKSFRS